MILRYKYFSHGVINKLFLADIAYMSLLQTGGTKEALFSLIQSSTFIIPNLSTISAPPCTCTAHKEAQRRWVAPSN